MTRSLWVLLHAVSVTLWSLAAAVVTSNPNWPTNIPLGLLIGASFGILTWPTRSWLVDRARDADRRAKDEEEK